MNKKKSLVTGASGFIGQHLVQALCGRKQEVVALTRDPTVAARFWSGKVTARRVDLTRPETVTEACRGVDAVFHLAGYAHGDDEGTSQAAERHRQVTLLGTRALIENAVRNEVRCFVFISSVKAIGEATEGCVDESQEPLPTTAYGKAKFEAEQCVLEAAARHGVHACVLRLPLVYGPGVKGNLLRMIDSIERGRFPSLPETGNQRSMVHVEDVVQATLLAAENPRANKQTYIVTDANEYSTRRIYEHICKGLGKTRSRWSISRNMLQVGARVGDMIESLTGRSVALDSERLEKLLGSAWYSSQKITRELGYKPTRSLDDSVEEIVEAYRKTQNQEEKVSL